MSFSKHYPDLAKQIEEAAEEYVEHDGLSPEKAHSHYLLAMQLREALVDQPEWFEEFDEEQGYSVADWLLALPVTLAHHGLVTEAAELGARFSEITEAANFLADRAVILAEGGRCQEALA